MELLLIRHGESDYIRRDGASSAMYDGGLTQAGHRQAQLLAQRLAREGIHHLYASPLLRARLTAEAVAAATGKALKIDVRLREVDPGAVKIERPEDARQAINTMLTRRGPMLLDFTQRGGEGPGAFGQRVGAAIHELLLTPHAATEERIAVVSHGGFINAAICALTETPWTGYARFSLNNCSITSARVTPEGRVILCVNDCEHLDEPLRTSRNHAPPQRR